MEQRQSFQQKRWNTWAAKEKKIKLDTDLTPSPKLTLYVVGHRLHLKCETVRPLEDDTANSPRGRHSDETCDETPEAQPMKGTIDKLDFRTVRNLCSTKDNFKRMSRRATPQENIRKRRI